MAVPAYATDLSDIYTDTDNFSVVGGGRVTAAETDDYIQGNNCWSHDPFSSGTEGGMYDAVTGITLTTDNAVFIWMKCDVAATLATHTAGGMQAIIGNGTTAFKQYYVRGSDDYQYGGWICVPVDPTLTPSNTTGTPSGTWDHFGVQWYVPSTGASKGYPMKIDAIRHGRNLEVTAGEVANPATWDDTAIYDSTGTRQWGILQPTTSGAALQGRIYWGTATTSVYSRDSNRTIVINDTEWTATDFTQVLFAHASNDIDWDNVGLIALGASNRGIINVTANGTVVWTNSVFQGIDTTTLLSNCDFDGSKWLGTNEVDAGGASLVGAQILSPTVAAASHALNWDVATDPNGLLDDMVFVKGTNAHAAIELGTNCPSTITLSGWNVSGFSAANGNNDSVIYNNSGKAITVNVTGNTGTISYRNGTSATTSIVADQRTLTINARDSAGNLITDSTDFTLVRESDTTVLKFDEDQTDGSTSYTYPYSSDTTCYINVVSSGAYIPVTQENVVLKNADATVDIILPADRAFSNP